MKRNNQKGSALIMSLIFLLFLRGRRISDAPVLV